MSSHGKNCSEQDLDQVVALSMMDTKGMDEDTVTWVRAVEALPVVSLLSLLTIRSQSGFRVTLKCYDSCGEKRCGPVCISKTRTTLLACLQQLHQQIMDHHGEECVAAAEAADAVSSNAAEGGASALAGATSNVMDSNVMDLMMRLSNTKARAVAANQELNMLKQRADKVNKEALHLEKAVDVAAKTVQSLQLLVSSVLTSTRTRSWC